MKPKHEPKTVTVHIRLPKEVYEDLRIKADVKDRSIHYLINEMLKDICNGVK